ncbi:molecular chaperone DnaJ [Geosmithia morbida]|uniref:Molecular chaperone DnaJ n=1 Tax=Geosmithia morbida TaxID=1094350 RepID=A0A9P4Z109_9HYPO|nr:molecular chaperone DnaJ [Geosmithia morbida]KAF4126726.1 molecular chaperone DnaJ [Geosmithia morbida]
MVSSRDYYADLELPPTAEIQDIRKQYRKLALKYHPDRNPGREHEANAQFLVIQKAHDVLTDPQQKAAFDATRGRATAKSRYPTASGVRGNPWADVAQQFPTPPRRNQSTRTPGSSAASGAERWNTRFSAGVPPTARQNAPTSSETRKNAAQTFANMRPKPQAKADAGSSRPVPPGPPPPTPPRTESAKQRQQAFFGVRRTGCQTRTTANGDEPPAASNNYSRRTETQNPPPPPPRPTPQPSTASYRMPDPLSGFREKTSSERQSSPYASHPGERTDPFDSSASPEKQARQQQTQQDTPPTPTGRPKAACRPRSKASESASDGDPKDGMFSAGTNPRADSQHFPMYEPLYNHYGSLSSKKHMHHSSLENHQVGVVQETTGSHGGVHLGRSADQLHQLAIPSGAREPPRHLSAFDREQHILLDRLIANAENPTEGPERRPLSPGPSVNSGSKANNRPYSFNIATDGGFTTPKPTTSLPGGSTEKINTSFVAGEDRNTWTFSAGTPIKDSPPESAWQQKTQEQQQQSPDIPPKVPEAETTNGYTKPAQGEGGFNAEGWSDQFGPETFVPPSRTNSMASPEKANANRKTPRRTKSTKSTTGDDEHSAILIEGSSDGEDEEEGVFTWRGRRSQGKAHATTGSPQAMDIDPPAAEPLTPSPERHVPRNIPVEPSRPEWRSGDFGGSSSDSAKPPTPEAVQLPQPPQPQPARVGGSEDSEEFKASFAELRNVAPFAPSDTGLRSLSDLRDSLPFESKPSNEIPLEMAEVTAANVAPQPLLFPNPPAAPRPPTTMGVASMKTNLPTWEKYVREFEEYERLWDQFNWRVTDHFATRKDNMTLLRREKGYMFLGARGDADFMAYIKTVQQDKEVRKRWDAACDEHEKRLQEFMAFREQMKA